MNIAGVTANRIQHLEQTVEAYQRQMGLIEKELMQSSEQVQNAMTRAVMVSNNGHLSTEGSSFENVRGG